MRLPRTRLSCGGEQGLTPVADNAKWSDLLPLVIQARVLQSFEKSRSCAAGEPAAGRPASDFQLITELRNNSDVVTGATPTAEVEFLGAVAERDGKIIAARCFQADEPGQGHQRGRQPPLPSMPRSKGCGRGRHMDRKRHARRHARLGNTGLLRRFTVCTISHTAAYGVACAWFCWRHVPQKGGRPCLPRPVETEANHPCSTFSQSPEPRQLDRTRARR